MFKSTRLCILIIAVLTSGTLLRVQAKCGCYEIIYDMDTSSIKIPYQSVERYPQTVINNIVTNFLNDEANDKDKKVLVLGYDGFREDALKNIYGMPQSALNKVMKDGGLYHSYAGANGKQKTSTAPGWLSILSGSWAYNLGVMDNGDFVSSGVDTFLNDAVKAGYASTFIASWAPHFEVTYREDINQSINKIRYQQMKDDDETLNALHKVLADTSPHSYDVVFSTLEYTDHAGHSIGYGNQENEYIGASQNVDIDSYKVLQTIDERSTIDDEDWLIIITTDHGGQGKDHGGQSDDEVNTWFAVNKDVSKILKELN